MKTINKFLIGVTIGSSLTLGIDYLFNGNKELINIGPFGEPALGDSYLIIKGIGALRHQTLYWPTILEKKDISDSIFNKSMNTLFIFNEYNLDTLQKQTSIQNLPLSRELIKRSGKHYIKI